MPDVLARLETARQSTNRLDEASLEVFQLSYPSHGGNMSESQYSKYISGKFTFGSSSG